MDTRLTIFQQYCDEFGKEIPFRLKAFVWGVITVGFFLTVHFLGWSFTPLTMLFLAYFFGIARTKKVE